MAAELWPQINGALRDELAGSVELVATHPDLEPATSGIFRSRFDLLWSDYSAGRNLNEIRVDFVELLDEWTPLSSDAGVRSLEVVVWMRAFGLDLEAYLPAWRHEYLTNRNIWQFLGWLYGVENPWEYPRTRKARGPWAEAIELAQQSIADPHGSVDELVTFVRQRWYRGSRGQWWWNTHNAENLAKTGLYLGYWCWEAAAIVLMTGVDDSQLKGLKYYPWDLVHYLDDTDNKDL